MPKQFQRCEERFAGRAKVLSCLVKSQPRYLASFLRGLHQLAADLQRAAAESSAFVTVSLCWANRIFPSPGCQVSRMSIRCIGTIAPARAEYRKLRLP